MKSFQDRAADFVEFWTWVIREKLMNHNTAGAYRSACKKILALGDGWEEQSVTRLDVDAQFKKYRSAKRSEMDPGTFESYKSRFMKAHESYLAHLRDPAGWMSVHKGIARRDASSGKIRQSTPRQVHETSEFDFANSGRDNSAFVEYPFPFRENRIGRLILPRDLKESEKNRLCAFLATLVGDDDSSLD
jgi:hypothetical protein